MVEISLASCLAELVGTFVLVLTVGCNILSSNPNWGGTSIASALMVMVYALGGVSGANFNPAVSVALCLTGKLEEGWRQVIVYGIMQALGGCTASVAFCLLFSDIVRLGPTVGFFWWQAMLCELFYTFLLCFVVLNTAASKRLSGQQQFYGLAIGFVIVAGAYGPGAVSGGCFNPAVALAIDAASIAQGFGWCIVYGSAELLGSCLAVLAFWGLRPEERRSSEEEKDQGGGQGQEALPAETEAEADSEAAYSLKSQLLAEALGTFVLVLTVGLNVLVASKAAAFSIAASLMCMIYAVGDVSGAHFNPAVTAAVLLSGRGKIETKAALCYITTQLSAGLIAALVYEAVHSGITFPLRPGDGFTWDGVAVAEILFTCFLCFVVLSVATVRTQPAPEFTGLIIGMCITVGGLAIGKVSGGSLNPAVSFGISSARKLIGGGTFCTGLLYIIFEMVGASIASGLFCITHPQEFGADPKKEKMIAET